LTESTLAETKKPEEEHQIPDDRFLELQDDQVTAADLIGLVRERLAERQWQATYAHPAIPEYALADAPPTFPEDAEGAAFSLYYNLQRAYEIYGDAPTTVVLTPSPATRIPLLGRLWALARPKAHELVLFYVNRLLAHETATQRHLIAALNALTSQFEEQQRTILKLQERVAELERQEGVE